MASSGSLSLELNQNAAFAHLVNSLKTAGAEVAFETPPTKVEFSAQKSEWGVKIGCEGEATIAPLPGGKSSVTVEVHASKNTLMYTIVTELVLFVVMWYLLGTLGVLIAVAGGVWAFWSYILNFPEQVFKKIRAAVTQGTSVVLAESGKVVSATSSPDIADQIRRLAELRDAGAITKEEFETKKAELLSRM